MKYFGAHVSIAGGVANAPENAAAIGATGFALFTKNQRQWRAPDLTAQEIDNFREACKRHGFAPEAILPHDSYLINLGNPDAEKRANATAAFAAELQRVEALGLKYLNFHPGSGLKELSMAETIRNIAEAIRAAVADTSTAIAVIENTAGQGAVCGSSLLELQQLAEAVGRPDRCAVCIDTCHAFAAGIDLATPEGYDAFWKEFDARLGRPMLRAMHLNDAKAPCGSHLDRHAPLGDGTIGWPLFERLAKDPALDGIPMILETPEPERWPAEIQRLMQAARN